MLKSASLLQQRILADFGAHPATALVNEINPKAELIDVIAGLR
ncbi:MULTISPECIES: hypothetical protein [unclassified Bradyrhizobium]|nr:MULTISPECIES: hypothetical protein [unclassified Bradyrhizobium]